MLSEIKEWFKEVIFNRFMFMIVVFVIMIGILIQRLFVMQIIDGADYLKNFTLTIKKETTLKSTRGNIYDRNGKLLAYNKLAYSVVIEDNYESGKMKNIRLNDTIRKTIDIIERNGDTVINDFNIILNESGEYEYTLSGTKLNRFLADVYGYKSIDDLKPEERNATPDELIEYLGDSSHFAVGDYVPGEDGKDKFIEGYGYTPREMLQVITVRYALRSNSYQKYISTVIAEEVNDKTVAAIMENSADLQGIGVEENTLREYNDSQYFAHIIGYTGYASTEDLVELADSPYDYNSSDMVGKSGIEKSMEDILQGKKGKNVIYVDNVGKVIETVSHIEPIAGNDVYLSIDADLQKAVYNMLEQKLAGILASKILNVKEYNNSTVKSSSMKIPVDDAYYALINNNIIDITHFDKDNAGKYEQELYNAFTIKQAEVMSYLREELLNIRTPYKDLSDEYKVYQSYIVSRLMSSATGVLVNDLVDRDDKTYIAWAKDETISLNEYLHYCLAQNWIDITKFKLDSRYSDSEEIYTQLIDYILNDLSVNTGFAKKEYKYMLAQDSISGRQICMILYEQKVLYGTSAEKDALESGAKTAYDFLINKIANLEITPAMLALDPCSGSCVVTNRSGELLALVTYPGYDNNKMANTIDSDYYAMLLSDLASPLYNNATQQMTAPGSTFKPISAACALEEGIVLPDEKIRCNGIYEYLDTEMQCWVYPGGHSELDVPGAIGNSCNIFFYEVGYRLATNLRTSQYDEKGGLERLKKYADMFGIDEKTGIEMEENEPKFSDTLPVDSCIGQGSHNYTTVGLSRYVTTIATRGTCYNYTLISKVMKPDGTMVASHMPTIRNSLMLSDITWDEIYSGMRLVIQKTKAFSGMPIAVAGKTGTAQTSKSRTNHALFIGFAPYEDPQMAVAVRIAYGYTSANAAALASDVIKYYFELEDRETLVNGIADTTEVEVIED